MKIAMFAPLWPANPETPSGILTYLSQIIPALRKAGHQVVILTPNKRSKDDDVIDVNHFCPRRSRFSRGLPGMAEAIKAMVLQDRVEILEMEESFGWSFEVSKLNLLPVVVRLHGPWFLTKTYEDKLRERREARALCSAAYITSPSRSTLNSVLDRYRVSQQFSSVLPNPLEIPDELWDINKCSKDDLLFVGRFDRLKGADTVLDAFARLAKTHPHLRLTIVGPDIGIDGVHFSDYVKAHTSERINFVGPLHADDINKLRLRSFLTIGASRYEVFGYTVLEAMALGCPVVAAAAGGVSEMIDSGSNGILYPAGDSEALASACAAILDAPETAKRYGAAARTTCAVSFSPQKLATHTLEFYRQAIDRFENQQDPLRKLLQLHRVRA